MLTKFFNHFPFGHFFIHVRKDINPIHGGIVILNFFLDEFTLEERPKRFNKIFQFVTVDNNGINNLVMEPKSRKRKSSKRSNEKPFMTHIDSLDAFEILRFYLLNDRILEIAELYFLSLPLVLGLGFVFQISMPEINK